MKKKIILVIMVMFFSIPVFEASCNDVYILNQAKLVEIEFTGKIAQDLDERDEVRLNISNLSDDMFVILTNETINEKETYRNIENGYLSIETPTPTKQYKYLVRVYSDSDECKNELILKENVVSLIFNDWSISTRCSESRNNQKKDTIPPVCDYFTDRVYSEAQFTKNYNDFYAKLNEPTLIDKFYKYYYFALIPMVILTFYYAIRLSIVRKRKKAQYEE